MKNAAYLVILTPGAALAHGGHAPVPELVHGLSHTAPVAGAAVIVLALLAGWFLRGRS